VVAAGDAARHLTRRGRRGAAAMPAVR
jgi:hypothetical protein